MFHLNKRKKAFPFASFDNLYILTKDTKRLINLENWFDGLENSLSLFIDKVSLHEKQVFKNRGHLNKLMMGLISFQFRSRYFFEIGIDYFAKNAELLKDFNNKTSLQIVLENVINATTDLTQQAYPVDLTIWQTSTPLLLCDRPLIFKKADGYSFIPLTPYIFLSFVKTSGESTIDYQIDEKNFASMINREILENARDWVISIEESELKKIAANHSFNHFDDQVVIEEFKTLISGYEY